jgi:DNA (cytosine-5)-methyltransferase 1
MGVSCPDSPSLRHRLASRRKRQPTQPTLAAALGLSEPRPQFVALRARRPPPPSLADGALLVVDLFCGLGGMSEGCRQAGHAVVLAVDHDEALLRMHAQNHADCHHVLATLGPDTEERLVAEVRRAIPEGRAWHLHASPPCTAISTIRSATRSRDVAEGMRLVMWYVALALRLRPSSWSMEQVGTPMLDGVLGMARQLHPALVDYASDVAFERYGVPQSRRRTIAGSPRLVQALRARAAPDGAAAAPVLSAVLTPPPGATLVKGAAGKCVDPRRTTVQANGELQNNTPLRLIKSVHSLCYTCLAGNSHYWCRPDFTTVRRFSVREQAALQTFPPRYKFGSVCMSIMGIGNAVPPLLAKQLMDVRGCVSAVSG